MDNPFFTVFTPVYNRRKEINRVYSSLQKQTFRNFEWIVIDDGSEDNVVSLLVDYKSSADFSIIIKQQTNSGKHIAWNEAVKMAQGELFVPADSDDEFTEDTLEFFFNKWHNLVETERANYSGINVLCMDPNSKQIIGDIFPKDGMVSNNLELYYKYKIKGEKWGCIRTDLLRKIPFPVIKRKGLYYPEGYIWFSLAKDYNLLCYNNALRLYYREGNSIMNTKNDRNKFNNYAPARYHYMIWNLNNNKNWMIKYSLEGYLRNVLSLCTNGLYLKKSWLEIISKMNGFINKVTTLLVLPVSFFYLKYLFYKFQAN